jgi:hypothetical protein
VRDEEQRLARRRVGGGHEGDALGALVARVDDARREREGRR